MPEEVRSSEGLGLTRSSWASVWFHDPELGATFLGSKLLLYGADHCGDIPPGLQLWHSPQVDKGLPEITTPVEGYAKEIVCHCVIRKRHQPLATLRHDGFEFTLVQKRLQFLAEI